MAKKYIERGKNLKSCVTRRYIDSIMVKIYKMEESFY